MLGFYSNASDAGVGFMTDFPYLILGLNLGFIVISPQTIVQGWLTSAMANNMGTPAAMGPVFNLEYEGQMVSICDYSDYYWGKGPVGPTDPAIADKRLVVHTGNERRTRVPVDRQRDVLTAQAKTQLGSASVGLTIKNGELNELLT